ncbi:hypothetical protein [Streptomyces bohaiensis]|uniref:Lipoprotein n=1 Tax=Streptomyces bohaiensis TaxID=1431344 RepID=A0ABX1C4N1_9ACTN|nr:hypothetical protein [Streptomyces bohaiensis]NJQ14176.1 hypothetical protein [Streptomyces bohaiensis]
MNQHTRPLRRRAAVCATAVVLAISGCGTNSAARGDAPADTAAERSLSDAAREVAEVSRALARAGGLDQGSLRMDNSPRRAPCPVGGDDPDLFTVEHVWSITGVPEQDLESALDRVHDHVREEGWSVLLYGPNSSPAEALELRAERPDRGHFVDALFLDARNAFNSRTESGIAVTVFTTCYRDAAPHS